MHAAKRSVSLLSGLLTCGCCNGRYGLITNDRFGCLNHHRRGTCDNNRTIRREAIGQRVLSGLNDRFVSVESVAEAVRAYTQETNRLNQDRRAQNEADRRALERRKAEIVERLAQAPADVPDVHPNVANIYRIKVATFILKSGPKRGQVEAELRGELMGILDFTGSRQNQRVDEVMTNAVARRRNPFLS